MLRTDATLLEVQELLRMGAITPQDLDKFLRKATPVPTYVASSKVLERLALNLGLELQGRLRDVHNAVAPAR